MTKGIKKMEEEEGRQMVKEKKIAFISKMLESLM